MDKKEKSRKRAEIKKHIDLDGAHLKDDEVNILYSFVTNLPKYVGLVCKIQNMFTSWSSDGKYTRKEETTYTIKENASIEENYQYQDDDGENNGDGFTTEHSTARAILKVIQFFGDQLGREEESEE